MDPGCEVVGAVPRLLGDKPQGRLHAGDADLVGVRNIPLETALAAVPAPRL